ncbi:MAG: FAD-linked oxidase C-terminal domain-containing protein [Planctomycetota bacterium]
MTALPVLPSTRAMPPARPAVDEQTARDLANAVAGEVRTGRHDRMLYSTDASPYQVEPLAVVIPADADDAVRAVRFCSERGLPMLPRGGGTSLAGQCTSRAVVLDVSPNCRQLLTIDAEAKTCKAESGITLDDLNDAIRDTGLFFPPDPSTSRHANLGGSIGNNAAGSRSVKYGRTSESLLGLDVALADGTRITLDEGAALRDARVRDITEQVLDVVDRYAGLIRERFPKTRRRNAGYAIDMILQQADAARADGVDPLERINLAHLLCGSEGTLATTLAAEVKLWPIPVARGLAVVAFAELDDAMDALAAILETKPSAVELLDDIVVDLARANAEYRRYVDLLPQPAGQLVKAVLYVEYEAERDASELRCRFDDLRRRLPGLAMEAHTEPASMAMAWKLRKAGEPLLHGIPGNRKPQTFVEDNAVPPERLPEFVRRFREIVERHGTNAAFYAHASVGVLHVRPLVDVHDADDRRIMQSIAVEVADLARELGGVMSGEHGDGRLRSPLLERFFGPELIEAFREIKAIFDPQGLLNPGNVVHPAGQRPIESMTESMRVNPVGPDVVVPTVDTYFDYSDQHGFDGAVEMCNGAGVCRKKQGGTMCPSYMGTLDERHSTRGRGNALRLAITGQIAQTARKAAWDDPDTIDTLDLCLSCKACKTECPSNVDISRLKAEYTAQRYRERGRPTLRSFVFGNVRTLNRLGSITPAIANWVNRQPITKQIVGRLLGVDERRDIPAFAKPLHKQARKQARKQGQRDVVLSPPKDNRPTVVIYGDCFTTYNEPGIGLASIELLQAFGYRVGIAKAACCGRAQMSTGLLPSAIASADKALADLEPWLSCGAVEGIVVLEPSCLSAIKDDWQQLKLATPKADRARVAAKSYMLEDFLERHWDAHPARPAFKTPSAETLFHGHCHQKALWGHESSTKLLQRVLGDDAVRVLDTGCCGMAGSFGYTVDRYDLSMKIGELALMPAVRAEPDAAVCAPGTSCRHQIADGTGRRAMHPAELLASLLDEG